MASLPYMQFYVADYLADTRHLTPTQHGIYLLLIMNYWQTGKPLPNNNARLARIVGIRTQDFVKNRESLLPFFIPCEKFLTHSRIERDLNAAYEKSSKASSSVRNRYSKDTTNVERTNNERTTNVLPIDKTRQDNTPLPPKGEEGRFGEVVDVFKNIEGATCDINRALKLWISLNLNPHTDKIIHAIGIYALTPQWQRGAIPTLANFISDGSWKVLPKLPYGAKSGIR